MFVVVFQSNYDREHVLLITKSKKKADKFISELHEHFMGEERDKIFCWQYVKTKSKVSNCVDYINDIRERESCE